MGHSTHVEVHSYEGQRTVCKSLSPSFTMWVLGLWGSKCPHRSIIQDMGTCLCLILSSSLPAMSHSKQNLISTLSAWHHLPVCYIYIEREVAFFSAEASLKCQAAVQTIICPPLCLVGELAISPSIPEYQERKHRQNGQAGCHCVPVHTIHSVAMGSAVPSF